MLKRIIHIFFAVIGIVLGYKFAPSLFAWIQLKQSPFSNSIFGAALGGILFFFATSWMADYSVSLIRWFEEKILKTPLQDVFAGVIGLIVGLIVAYLLAPAIGMIPVVGPVVQIFASVFLAYLGFRICFTKREELVGLFSLKFVNREKGKEKAKINDAKILDTSVIIDGRIADIVETGFLDGTLVIPSFVLEELQHIADSSDVLKRNRGRRGLDILNKIRKEQKSVRVQVLEIDFEEIQEVDSKLVRLAKQISGKVVTNDFNLNKVCELQGVPVLNINDLANAVKPVVLPGEEIIVQVIKDGKEFGQGVGYLDDGTMIVVEGGREFIGSRLEVLVTSVLQTSAGRMIFAKPKLLEKAQAL
ncbi:putative PIN and TRAM-domain containing protein YacL [Collibacillus ludicampi]|uniref:PIN and TRAM-domain containing protein YacL n=1 Tax=Collibacillus ludicampi TaxID=2771369 RepID=A0AAV4LE51_9BACL|nr:PIN/TRAM domain-containing protein [Collibacillus ludicampi]GIM46094.1 putative PIN and TRAM-domain containing protein YacL [Collibacillus ludicampi]